MRKPRQRAVASVESMESRELLSGTVPVLTMNTYNAVVADVQNVMGTLAKTHNFKAAVAGLTDASTSIPYGGKQLSPTWQADLGTYSPTVPGSGLAAQRKILLDLNQYIIRGVHARQFIVTGKGSEAFYNASAPGVGTPAVSQDAVTIRNNSGYAIQVRAFLNGTQRSILKQIPVNGTAVFDFNSYTNNYISINIGRADNLSPPPASYNNLLGRPVGGYYGTQFTISVFANLFSVSV